jgi:uncharacterized membrane protein
MGMRPLIVALSYGFAGLVFLAMGIPLALRKVRPNPWYGFRTAKTLSDPAVWYAANRLAGVDLIVAGVVLMLGVAAMFLLRHTMFPALPIANYAFGLFLALMLAVVLHGYWFLSRM